MPGGTGAAPCPNLFRTTCLIERRGTWGDYSPSIAYRVYIVHLLHLARYKV